MQELPAAGADGAEANGGGDAGRALEERAKVQTLLQAAQDGDMDALKACSHRACDACLDCTSGAVPTSEPASGGVSTRRKPDWWGSIRTPEPHGHCNI